MLEKLCVVGACITFLAYLPTCAAILRKTAKPTLSSWCMWSVMDVVILASQIAAGKEDPWGMLAATVGTVAATILLLVYGEKRWTKFDTVCLLLAVTGMVVWKMSGPVPAQFASLAAVSVAGIPTMRNAWSNPRNENRLTWAMLSVGFGLTFVGVSDWSQVTNWIQPLVCTMFTLTVLTFSLRRGRS